MSRTRPAMQEKKTTKDEIWEFHFVWLVVFAGPASDRIFDLEIVRL